MLCRFIGAFFVIIIGLFLVPTVAEEPVIEKRNSGKQTYGEYVKERLEIERAMK